MVYFIGAGPGDPKLLTIKGKEIIDRADVIIYAGSLVNEEVLNSRKAAAKVYNSAVMTLDEVIAVMQEAEGRKEMTARVHTGDPSLYGAHREQMDRLKELGISYEIVPGVSSFLAAAASLGMEYTLPGVSQSLIISRIEGRTKVPAKEQIEELAKANTSMVLFLSAGKLEELCERLMSAYPKDTPAAVVYKASWPDEKQVRGDLSNIAQRAREAGIHKTALLLVGNFLGENYEYSKLYDKYFSHEFRKAVDDSMNKEKLEAFFAAENKRDWQVYQNFLHEDVVWKLFDHKEREIRGIESYMQTIKRAYENTGVQFSCEEMKISDDGNRIVAHLVNDFGVRSVDIFDFKDGLIYREYEFILD